MIYLLGSGQPKSELWKDLLDRAFANARAPRVAISLAPISGSPGALKSFSSRFTSKTFGGAEVKRFSVAGEPDAQPAADARRTVADAQLVFVSGGDPVDGARLLVGAGADQWLREASARGATLAGGSAGSILLGAFWAEWPEEPNGRPFDGGELVRCTGAAGDLVVDTHDEDDDWGELKMVHGMLRAAGHPHRVRGIPTHGALVVHAGGRLESVGEPAFELP